MNKVICIIGLLLTLTSATLIADNAPVSTIGTVTASGTTAKVPITAINFINIRSCNLKLLYNSSIVSVTGVTNGPAMAGTLSTDLSIPGVISLGWFTYPGLTIPDNSVMFNISFSRVAFGTSSLTWSDNGSTCMWRNGDMTILNDVPTSTYYINGSVTFYGALVADFSANTTTPPKNTTVQFTDLTTGGPTGWDWSFDRTSIVFVNGTSHSSQNPQVQFTEGGLYTVTLTASNPGYSNTKVKTGYICAGSSGLWCGTVSSSWTLPANWDNGQVPGSSTDIVIPGSCTHWPVYDGNLTVGVDCRSLILSSPASQIIVNGNLVLH